MTVDLVQFLHDRLDDDEQTARRAISGQVDWEEGWGAERSEGHRHTTIVPHVGMIHEAVQAQHIARHDPARVLAEVEAKRQIVRAHAKWCEGRCEAKYPEGSFDAAHYWSLKALAAVYADHPEYRPEWRP
ncbi:DUF6221 family protein [Streptomyces sp. NPDC001515]